MAGLRWKSVSGNVSTGSGALVVHSIIAPAIPDLIITLAQISLTGTATGSVKCELCRWDADGAGGSAGTVEKIDEQDDTAPATTAKTNYSSNPPAGSTNEVVLMEVNVSTPGTYTYPGILRVKRGQVMGWRTNGGSVTANSVFAGDE